jgi:sodium-dependent dicarboxylate transporter 2/3/5
VLALTALVVFLTELTSNTATAATFLPVLGGVALGAGLNPVLLVVPAALAASCAFMLPVATPPNAVVFGSERVRIGEMVRAGLALNLVAVVLIWVAAFTVLRWVLL